MEKLNKPTRLRTLILRHLDEINPNVCLDKITLLEDDIKTFVKSVVHNANDLGLVLSCESYIGDLD